MKYFSLRNFKPHVGRLRHITIRLSYLIPYWLRQATDTHRHTDIYKAELNGIGSLVWIDEMNDLRQRTVSC